MTSLYHTVRGPGWTQEVYSDPRESRARAAALRRLGLRARAGSLGPQITQVGRIVLYAVTIHPGLIGGPSLDSIPAPAAKVQP